MSRSGYNGRDTIFGDWATITSSHACVGVTSLPVYKIGVQIGTHDLFYVWTCQSIMSLLECMIGINQDTGFAHVRFF